MQLMNDKTTGGSAPQKDLTSGEFNQFASEAQNVITDTGQTLSSGDLDQLNKGISVYASSGDFYVDSGAADAYVLSATGSKKAPPASVDGLRSRFIPGNVNTGGAATVNVATLGVESIKLVGGVTNPPAGSIAVGVEVTLIRRTSPGIHHELSQVSGTDIATPVSGYSIGDRTYLNVAGGSTVLLVPTTVVSKNSSETIGPTGSGADNIWTALNEVPVGASGVYLSINSLISMSSINTGDMFSFARDGDSAVTPVFNTRISEVSGENAIGDEFHAHNTALVPVNSARVFSFYWSGSNTTINTINMALKGFVK